MGSWPYTRLHVGRDRNRCVAISGPHIQVFDLTSGDIRAATRCAGIILHSAVDQDFVYIVTTGHDKKLNVWHLDDLRLRSSRELPKKATAVQLSRDGQTIIVADKFGDVFGYPLDPPTDATLSRASEPTAKELQASHENPHGTLILGHASIITSLLLTRDGRYIITADRDEHIRVSRYPHGYIIERYCMGHQSFVSAICVPPFDPSSLISGGGDPSLNIWDWMSGTLKCQIPVLDAVKPFLKVRQRGQRWHGGEGDPGKARGQKRRRRGKKGHQTPADAVMATPELPSTPDDAPTAATQSAAEEDPVFALAKLEAFEFDGEKLLVFSGIGGSALFYCTYPSQTSSVPTVRHLDCSKPVLDFVLAGSCQLLVSVDAAWPSRNSTKDPSVVAMRLITWQGGEFRFVKESSTLLASMHGSGSQEASPAELGSLDLYANLALFPKHPNGPEEGDDAGDEDFDMRPETPQSLQGDSKQQRAKATGRSKTRQAVLSEQVLDVASSQSPSGDEREAKKTKVVEEDL